MAVLLGAVFIITCVNPKSTAADNMAGTTPERITQADIDNTIDILAPKFGLTSSLVKKISSCEDQGNPYATHQNFRKDGSYGSVDYGPLQINSSHKKDMVAKDLNIKDPMDNLYFGLEMMRDEGTAPWSASEPCWASAKPKKAA